MPLHDFSFSLVNEKSPMSLSGNVVMSEKEVTSAVLVELLILQKGPRFLCVVIINVFSVTHQEPIKSSAKGRVSLSKKGSLSMLVDQKDHKRESSRVLKGMRSGSCKKWPCVFVHTGCLNKKYKKEENFK